MFGHSKTKDAHNSAKRLRSRGSILVRDSFPPLSGKLEKKNRHGKWQSRYFVMENHYIKIYKSDKKKEILAGVDLKEV